MRSAFGHRASGASGIPYMRDTRKCDAADWSADAPGDACRREFCAPVLIGGSHAILWPEMALSPEARALPLIALIHRTVIRPAAWETWLAALSAELGDPAIMLTLQLSVAPASTVSYRVHAEPKYGQIFADLAGRGRVPWPLGELFEYERFVFSSEFLSDEDLANTEFFEAYMEPQGLVVEGQMGHVFGCADGRPLAAVGIYRRVGGREFTPDDVAMLDLLVPHLRQAYDTYCELRDIHFRRDAMSEAMNRFPMGVLFLDRGLEMVHANRAAVDMLDAGDGITLQSGILQVTQPSASKAFAAALDHALESRSAAGMERRICRITRPSGRRPYEALVTSLAIAPQLERPRQPAVVVFLADPEDQQLGMPRFLGALHDLTSAEAELAALLCAGESMESAAVAQKITVHTARTHLKHIFAKTGVKRQADLVRLLLSSVTALDELSIEFEIDTRDRSDEA